MGIYNILKVIGSNGNQLFGTGNQGPLSTTTATGGLFDKLWMLAIRRNANATPETMRHDCGLAPPFHHLLDPTNARPSSFTLVWENVIQGSIALGSCRVFAGFVNWLTVGTNTLVGIGFYADPADNLWHCFVADCPTGVAPVTSRYDNATTVLMTAVHRMRIVIAGPTKTVKWYIDNVQVGTFTPAAALDQMGPSAVGPEAVYGAVVPANGDVTVRGYAGSLPNVRYSVLTPA